MNFDVYPKAQTNEMTTKEELTIYIYISVSDLMIIKIQFI